MLLGAGMGGFIVGGATLLTTRGIMEVGGKNRLRTNSH